MYFVVGDIHGAFKALKQVLVRSGFKYQTDTLICLGDTCDGWPQVKECFDELLKIKNLIHIMGNHDKWFLHWATYGVASQEWIDNGGRTTISSYGEDPIPESHIKLVRHSPLFYKIFDTIFVHGGIDPDFPVEEQDESILLWDRKLFARALEEDDSIKLGGYSSIFIGHTSTTNLGESNTFPILAANVWNMDTGAGWNGRLSIMNLNNNEIYQSDLVQTLYPEESKEKKV